ncbi:type II toxin-antitoxin system HicB family antitoxin [Salinibacter ruber]|uniref:type II toxin-antitoxin system HicB family antitoxin n=1 Tax=Salinibacter ruber TaxID=146919 RepID=UPI002169407D|nr:type II toxin-antitoxin system HicB family antitoxin [Salinibacter ruber]MCS3638952.1 putative transcriptional regulator [Salinibacter ruber]MCS4099875.1 putative transcriptional regulator [Salinibacter ruber]MCS4149144.1 putative transcriptional regulator [Salinibacter ruber]
MGALTVRLPESLHEKVRDLAEEEGISMNQLVMLAVSEKITRLDAEAQFAHLDALERFGEAVAEEESAQPDELMEELLRQAGDEEPQEGDRRPAEAK